MDTFTFWVASVCAAVVVGFVIGDGRATDRFQREAAAAGHAAFTVDVNGITSWGWLPTENQFSATDASQKETNASP